MLDDWGDGKIIGMNSSGSNSFVVEDVFVADRFVVPFDWFDPPHPSVGVRFHRNPAYIGRVGGPYHASLVGTMIGAARASLDEFGGPIGERLTTFQPQIPRREFHEDQRVYGLALAKTDAAEAILYAFCREYQDLAERSAESGDRIPLDQDARWWATLQQAGGLASDAVEMLNCTARRQAPPGAASGWAATSGTSRPTVSTCPRSSRTSRFEAWRCTGGCRTAGCSEVGQGTFSLGMWPVGRLLSLNVECPRDVAWEGRTVRTAIWKSPSAVRAWSGGSTSTVTTRPTGPPTVASTAPSSSTSRLLPLLEARARATGLQLRPVRRELHRPRGWPTTTCASAIATGSAQAIFEVTQPRVTCFRVGIRMREPGCRRCSSPTTDPASICA